jgi:hypothetical protein
MVVKTRVCMAYMELWKCGLDMPVTTALKNDLFSVFSYWRGIYPNQQLICFQNIPNLSTI